MNDIINKFLLSEEKLCPSYISNSHSLLTVHAVGPFTKNKERIEKFKETGDTKYIYRNELNKACFLHDMTYGDFKDLARRTAADNVLRDKAFNIAKDPRYDGYRCGLASMV